MRKKIILGIVILAAIVGAVYFNKNYAVLEGQYGNHFAVRVDTAWILDKNGNNKIVKCTPNLKKLTKLEKLWLAADENMNLDCLSEMEELYSLEIFYFDGYCGRLETLPELPNLRNVALFDALDNEDTFTIFAENKYVQYLELRYFDYVDFNSLNYFKKLRTLELWNVVNGLTEEQIEELQSRGINVEIV